MDQEDETGSAGQGQNLQDLQNYLSTFNKEIEPGDDILSSVDVDGAVGDVGDLYSSSSGNPLQESGEGTVTSQFSSGFYSEQGILDTTLSDETAQQIQNLVAETDRDTDTDITAAIKQEVGSIDLENVQAQIANFGDTHVIGGINSSSLSQGLVMTSLGDSLDPSAGKVIRIVSLGDDGQFLSLSDGSQMQILNQDLGISADTLSTSDGALGNESSTIITSSPHSTSLLGATSMVLAGRGTVMSLSADTMTSNTISGRTQLVAVQGTSGSGQSQLVAFSQGAALTTESLQMSGLLAADGTSNSELGYQTITILPSELNQNGDMNYVLIMAPPDTHKDGGQSLAQVIEDLKQESQELSEELVEINGEMKRVLRVVPKKFITANFGAQLMCNYCDYTSPKRYLLTRHMKSHSDERPHKCKECERGFKTPASLLNHINTHTGTRPHKCKTCEAAFTTSGELVRHIRYRHTFEKPHRCPNCDYASVELSKLKRHMRSHTGERPYKCPHCPYASPDTYKLKRHLRIHTGEKPYECDICHARFTQSNSLKAHKLIHSGNKPIFQCDLCPTTCGRKTDLKIHFNKLHSMGSPLECKKCGQVFSDRYSYKQHTRGHDIDKCLKCGQCDFVANTERSLDHHAAVHITSRKFECDACHSSFNLKQTLDKHKHSCHLEGESGVDSQSSCSRDKENKDDAVYSLDGSTSALATSSQLVCGPLASDTLHKNLLQDIKAGKLGDVPQVVIVHPDGSLEEISSKGDKLNIEDIFSALSSSGRIEGADKSRERNQAKGSNDLVCSSEMDIRKQSDGKQELSDDDEEEDEEEEENGETSQCEASTQAELESDTDSVDDDDSQIIGSPSHFPQSPEKARPHLTSSAISESMGEQSTSSDMETTAVHNTEAASEALNSLLHNTEAASEALSSLLHNMTTTTTVTSSEQALSSGQQFVMVKGYTCLNNDTTQPTLVNVAVDKDSLMKMFASLATSSEGGMHLLTGDLESPIAISIDNSQAASLPINQLQLHHFGIIPGLPGSLIVATNFEQNDDPNSTQGQDLARRELISANSKDLSSPSSKASTSTITCIDNSQLRVSHDLSISHGPACLEMGIFDESSESTHGNTPTETESPTIITSQSNDQFITEIQTRTEDDRLMKGDHLDEQTQPDPVCGSDSKVCLPDKHLVSKQFHCGNSLLDNVITSSNVILHMTTLPPVNLLADKCTAHTKDTGLSQDSAAPSPQESQSTKDLDSPVDISALTFSTVVKEVLHPPADKQKRSNRKRTATTNLDLSLVMTGKRVRKTLVKVSM